jgi:Protein of unknown function (DUF1153)
MPPLGRPYREPLMKTVTDKHAGKHAGRTADIVVLIPADLPSTNTVRWFAPRKARVVAAVQDGALSVAEVCLRYGLSQEEYREWERHYIAGDLRARRVSRQQHLSALQ